MASVTRVIGRTGITTVLEGVNGDASETTDHSYIESAQVNGAASTLIITPTGGTAITLTCAASGQAVGGPYEMPDGFSLQTTGAAGTDATVSYYVVNRRRTHSPVGPAD